LLGLTPDPALRTRRLRKMVLKNIGTLAFGLAESRNRRSALYDGILSTNDLDFMTEEFRPRPPSVTRRNWLRRADATCERGIVEAKALIARSPLATRADVLAFARAAIAVEAGTRSQLVAIQASPEDRVQVKALLALFGRSLQADRTAVARLSASWSDAVARRWLEEGTKYSLALESKALELGSRGCGRYFDPATYTR
jgi:hypothetical protein